jgi:hypothetical protein
MAKQATLTLNEGKVSLPVKLTLSERDERVNQATQQARRAAMGRAKEVKLKQEAKDARDDAEGAARETERLLGVVEAGEEYRPVEVEWVYLPQVDMVEQVRLDTGEVLDTRTPNESDKEQIAKQQQRTLPGLDAAEPAPKAKGSKAKPEIEGAVTK